MGKSTISMAMFNSYVKLPEGNNIELIYIDIRIAMEAMIHRNRWFIYYKWCKKKNDL